MATNSWRGGSGRWSAPTNWSLFSAPASTDSAILAAGSPYTVTLDDSETALNVSVASGATLALTGTLALGGTLSGAGAVTLSGLLVGGTLDMRQGSASGAGTLEGVTVLGSLAGLNGLTMDGVTAQDSALAAGGTLAVPQQTTLLGGRVGGTTMLLNQAGTGATLTSNGTVTLGQHQSIVVVEDPAQTGGTASVVFAGSGFINQGTIGGQFADAAATPLAITAGSFSSNGVVDFEPVRVSESNTFVVGLQDGPHGTHQTITGELNWTQLVVPVLTVSSSSFTNSGSFFVNGGTLDFTGAGTLNNSGLLWLQNETGQTVTTDAQGVASVVDVPTSTVLEVGAGIASFSNTGQMIANLVQFDNAVRLASLGVVSGALSFTGTLDLGGGTLDASSYGTVTISGTVENGVLAAGDGRLLLQGATLLNTQVAAGGDVENTGTLVVIDPKPGVPTTLDAVTTQVLLTPGSTSAASITAGSTAVVDSIALRADGTVTLGAAFNLTAAVAGSTVEIAGAADGGASAVVFDGNIAVSGATLLVTTTLDGNGRIAIGEGGVVTLDALAVTAAPTIAFGAGPALVVLPGTGALGVTFSGLQPGDVVDFQSVSSVPDGQFGAGGAAATQGTLFITGASGDTASLPLTNSPGGLTFHVVPDGSGGSLMEVACFLRGTRLATPGGPAPVESLRPGDAVLTAGGRVAPVRWMGCTAIDLARHPNPARAAPVRILAGALAEGLPQRDLLVSPEHCLLLDGALIPAVQLVNGASIARDDGFAAVEYWHIELDRHDAVLAEGVAAESYLDTGNRALFAGEAGVRAMHPDLAGAPDAAALAIWAAQACAPLRLAAEPMRVALRRRAEAAGWRLGDRAKLRLLAGGGELAWHAEPDAVAVTLPAGVRALRLLSASFVPSEVQTGEGDTRRLGIAVSAALLAGWPLHPDAFADGWHAATEAEPWRWTTGDATLTFPRLARPTPLRLRLGPDGLYWNRTTRRKALRAA